MTDKQKHLLNGLYSAFKDLAEECEEDDDFHDVMIRNNDLYPMSLDELADEWLAVQQGKRK